MIKLKELISLKRPSLVNIILPYIIFKWNELSHSPFYKIQNILFLFSILIITELLYKIFTNKIIAVFILAFTLICFYGYFVVGFISYNTDLHIRGRIIMPIILIFVFIILFLSSKKLTNYKIINTFFLILSFISLVNQIINRNNIVYLDNYKSNYLNIKKTLNSEKPVVLIITDEYTSPDGLYKIYKDSSIYSFSNKLVSKDWQVKNSFYSYETSTIHSLSSLFNFNLSKNISYKNITTSDLGAKRLMQAAIYDSLKVKKISILNYGIFDIGEIKPLTRLYFYPHNFFEAFLKNTSIFPIIYNTGGLDKKGFEKNYYPMEEHNKFIFNNFKNDISKIKSKYFFAYVHLYMPHTPMQYEPEFALLNSSTNNYYAYWNFTNKKLDSLLNRLIQEDKFRIILTGDHGFRSDIRINPHYTFTAFYGFEQEAVNSIKSVQDIGSLINSGY
jgi:hypothetical protein